MKKEVLRTMYQRGYLLTLILVICALFGIVQKWLPVAFLVSTLILHWQYKTTSKEENDEPPLNQ